METLTLVLNILTVAVGLGFVIFFHELGHFLLAKWNGVKVEKFSIGFDPFGLRFYSYQFGETTYVLGAIPLGGYVKMLGEEASEQAETSTDPRAYHNKSVGARMAIISAGVLMNLVLGLACFIFAYGWGGLLEMPAKVGMVVAGGPAYEVGVRTGDEIVAIDGKRNVSFEDLMRSVALSGTDQVVRFDLKRPGQDSLLSVPLLPRREARGEKPTVGIRPALGLTLPPKYPFVPPPGLVSEPPSPEKGFKGKDRLTRVGPPGQTPQPVADEFDLHRLLASFRDKPLVFEVERDVLAKTLSDPHSHSATVTLPPNHFVDFGFRLKIEPIGAIQGGSIAEKAGFQKGDLIVRVDGKDDFDPMRLPSYCYERAGQPIRFDLERRSRSGKVTNLTLTVKPDATPPWSELIFESEPLKIPGLGLAYPVRPQMVAVKDGSPAARAGLKVGDEIHSMTMQLPDPDGSKPKPYTCDFDDKKCGWPHAFAMLQDPAGYDLSAAPERAVKLTIGSSKTEVSLVPEPDPNWFHPSRGLRFEYLKRPLLPLGLTAAIGRGSQETLENVVMLYYILRGLGQGRVSPKNFGGPIRIPIMAYYFVTSGAAPFLWFLGMLSVNLAVINFFPIPPLDGGQMAFLIAEKVRGRPLPESLLSAGMITGIVLVLGLMAFIIFQDFVYVFLS